MSSIPAIDDVSISMFRDGEAQQWFVSFATNDKTGMKVIWEGWVGNLSTPFPEALKFAIAEATYEPSSKVK